MKILIVDDHKMFADGLKALLLAIKNDLDIHIASDGIQAMEFIQKHRPDIVTTDISMPKMNGIELVKKINSSDKQLKVIVISMHTEVKIIKSILKENPDGYLLKNTDVEELKEAINCVMAGEQYYCKAIKNLLLNNVKGIREERFSIIPRLSPREKEVLKLLVDEKTTGEIAKSLHLSLHTIESYRKNLLQKLGAKNSVGLVAKAYQLGLL